MPQVSGRVFFGGEPIPQVIDHVDPFSKFPFTFSSIFFVSRFSLSSATSPSGYPTASTSLACLQGAQLLGQRRPHTSGRKSWHFQSKSHPRNFLPIFVDGIQHNIKQEQAERATLTLTLVLIWNLSVASSSVITSQGIFIS